MKRAFLATLLTCLALAKAGAAPQTVTIDTGMLAGTMGKSVVFFKGIPFVAPPVGALRWRPPAAAKPWAGLRQATAFGPDCPQIPFPGDKAVLRYPPAEDCLTLNVWAPTGPLPHPTGHGRPVMVWIYGGGFVNGGSSPAIYDGSAFARDGVVLVSFNYRIGRLGFFAHPALSAESPGAPLADYAFMDQIAALQWVRRNIAAFGGDPGNVTIFGESAGGASVNLLLSSPPARGLFHKAIVESGAGRGNIMAAVALKPAPGMSPVETAHSGEAAGLTFARENGITDTGPAGLAALRALPVEKVVGTLSMMTLLHSKDDFADPIADGSIIRGVPLALDQAGDAAPVPVLLGANTGDGYWHGTTLDEALSQLPSAPRATLLRAYDPDGTLDPMAVGNRIDGDIEMVEPIRAIERALSAHGNPVFAYRFGYVAESKRGEWPFARHASELPFVFDTMQAYYGDTATRQDAAMATMMHALWVNFAKSGVPSAPGAPAWPRFSAKADALMFIGPDGIRYAKDGWTQHLDVAERFHPGPK